MQTLTVNTETMRVEMARAKISTTLLAQQAGVHRNCINRILRTGTADLNSIGTITWALNNLLQKAGYTEIGPFGLLKSSTLMSKSSINND